MMAVIMTAMANKSNVTGALCAKSCRYSAMAPLKPVWISRLLLPVPKDTF
mgnify:CR=1 FL=1